METVELDSLFLSKRILVNIDECKDFISGGILVSNVDGIIKRIFTSQQEINSWMFGAHGAEVYDFGEKVIMSGLIDANVNICSGGDCEDFCSITKAAGAGGYTCIVDNPLTSKPPTTTLKNLKDKITEARKKNSLHIDVAFWGGVIADNHEELLPMANLGVCGFKGALNSSDCTLHLNKESLKSALETLEETNCVFAIKSNLDGKSADGTCSKEYQSFLALNPASIERAGVEIVIELIKQHKMHIHLTDISSAECLPLISKYNSQKTSKQSTLSIETSYPYLTLTSDEISNGKTENKCMPPIRNANNKSKLWEAMKCYEFSNISSSHMASTIKSKCLIGGRNRGNFIEASFGISSLQFGLPIFWTECQKNSMSIHDVHRFMSYHPAKLCGLDKNKGLLKVGYDADFCIWDPSEEWTITKEADLLKNKTSPYYGMVVKGRVYATVVRGFFVYDGNHPNDFDEAIGTIILKKPMKRSERRLLLDDDDETE
ncbi:hypothetical protein PVAND_001310 [Polypedilum vanderplanki]|uniref:Allantoinase n=1 Tax=Polypedilum vanderplanki TaxID=319348 RepID=A0A9J6BMZ8_POLVA|nr:hypothetical protein PVAND_001310 [Polypedilum vanderplanki]